MIRFVVALAVEARPLITRYRMERVDAPFPLYRHDGCFLIVSGMGAVAAASAVGYLGGRYADSSGPGGVWLNVGVAGHRYLPPGELRLAHTVRDEVTGGVWYPPRIAGTGGPTLPAGIAVRTVPEPELDFETEDLYEMEASGFYPSAIRFATAELVQCCKVVSDNASTDPATLSTDRISGWIESKLDDIVSLASHVAGLAQTLPTELAAVEESLDRSSSSFSFSLSTSEQRKLKRLLVRLTALGGTSEVEAQLEKLTRFSSARDAIRELTTHVDELALR